MSPDQEAATPATRRLLLTVAPAASPVRGERRVADTGISSNIEITIETERLSDHFLMSPNDLHRGMGEWAGLTLRARALLAALLTTKSGWTTSRAAVDALAPELGTRGVTTVLNELRTRRLLYTHRVNAGHGRFTWRWFVYLRPKPEGYDPTGGKSYPQALPSGHDGFDLRKQGVRAGRTIRPSGHDGFDLQKQGVRAGRTIRPSEHDGCDLRKQGTSAGRTIRPSEQSIRSTSLEVPEELTPPTPHAATADHASGRAATEGEGNLGGDKPKPQNQNQERADGESQLVLRDVCYALSPAVIPVGGSRARLLVLVDRALGAGWSRTALVERISGNGLEGLDQAGRVFGMLRYRLEHVGAPDDCRPVPSRPLVAGRTGHHRYVEDMPGYDQCAVCGMGRRNFRHGENAPVIEPEGCEPGLVADPSVPPREAAVRSLVGAFRGLSV